MTTLTGNANVSATHFLGISYRADQNQAAQTNAETSFANHLRGFEELHKKAIQIVQSNDPKNFGNGPTHAVIFDDQGKQIGRLYQSGVVVIEDDAVGLFGGTDPFKRIATQTAGMKDSLLARTNALQDLLGKNGQVVPVSKHVVQNSSGPADVPPEADQLTEIQLVLNILMRLMQHGRGSYSDGLLSWITPRPFDTVTQAQDNAVILGTTGRDRIDVYYNATITAAADDDYVTAYGNAKVDGGGGNDRIETYGNAAVQGGDGHDYISTYGDSTASGGAGNDVISGYHNVNFSGGRGNDRLSGYNNAVLDGGDGNDYLDAYSDANLTGGAGDDIINAYDRAIIDAGFGNDVISVGADARIRGGAGDDKIVAYRNTTITYDRGDGHDTLSSHHMATSTLEIGAGITADQVKVEIKGKDLRISFTDANGSITLKDYRGETPTLIFADGSSLDVNALLKA